MNILGHIQTIINLNEEYLNRKEFHKRAGPQLQQIASNKNFWEAVIKINLSDKNFLNRKWSMYEIPFFYVFENNDFYLKIHLFVALKTRASNVAASAIHHHNNYLLTSFAAHGSGYETILFEKEMHFDENNKTARLKIREHFTQKERPLHMVDAWEPHVVINPTKLSATFVLWSPDKKRSTDKLRNNPILKFLKTPLRKLIYILGLDKKVGIAVKDTYQFYPEGNNFKAILEDEFFAPTRNQVGSIVNDYSVQTIFRFMQEKEFSDMKFLKLMLNNPYVPSYYHKFILAFIEGKEIPETYAKEEINVPNKKILLEEIVKNTY
jgi:hypothetical protein